MIPPHFLRKDLAVNEPNTLLIASQQCGCPCPSVRILKGKLIIPDSIQAQYPDIYVDQINLSGQIPYEHEVNLFFEEIYIQGEVVGIDTVLCTPNSCEIVGDFQINHWQTVGYPYVYMNLYRMHPLAIVIYFSISLILIIIGVSYILGGN